MDPIDMGFEIAFCGIPLPTEPALVRHLYLSMIWHKVGIEAVGSGKSAVTRLALVTEEPEMELPMVVVQRAFVLEALSTLWAYVGGGAAIYVEIYLVRTWSGLSFRAMGGNLEEKKFSSLKSLRHLFYWFFYSSFTKLKKNIGRKKWKETLADLTWSIAKLEGCVQCDSDSLI